MLRRSILTLSRTLFRKNRVFVAFSSEFKSLAEAIDDQLENDNMADEVEAEQSDKQREHTELELSLNVTPKEFEEIKKELCGHTAIESLRTIYASLKEIDKTNDFETESRANHLLLEALVVLQTVDSASVQTTASHIWEPLSVLLEQFKVFLKKNEPRCYNFSYFTLSFLRFYLLTGGVQSQFELATQFKNLLSFHVQNLDFIDYSQLISLADEVNSLKAENELFINLIRQTQMDWHLQGVINNFWDNYKLARKSIVETTDTGELLKIAIHFHQNDEFPPVRYVINPKEKTVAVSEMIWTWSKPPTKPQMIHIAKQNGIVLSALSAMKSATLPTKFHKEIVTINFELANFIKKLKSDCKDLLLPNPSLMLRFAASLPALNNLSQLNNEYDLENAIQHNFENTIQNMPKMSPVDIYFSVSAFYQMLESRTTIDRRIKQFQLSLIENFTQSLINSLSGWQTLSSLDFKIIAQIIILLVSNKHDQATNMLLNRTKAAKLFSQLKLRLQEIDGESCYRLLKSISPKNEFLLSKGYKVSELQEFMAKLCERILSSGMQLSASEYLIVAIAYQLSEEFIQTSVNQEIVKKYSKVETLEESINAFTFWRVFMIYSSEGQIMHEAASLKRLQMSIKTQEIVSNFLTQNRNNIDEIARVIRQLGKLQLDCRFNVPSNRKNALFRLKSTKRHVERLIYDFGEMTLENTASPHFGLLNNNLDAVLELTEKITIITSTYNLLCSRPILDNVIAVWEKRKDEFTVNHMNLFLATFFDSSIMPSMRPHMIAIVQWMLNFVAECAQNEALFVSKIGRNEHLLARTVRFMFPEVNYQPAMMAIVELFSNEKVLKRDSLVNTCLRFLLFFIEGNKKVVQSLLPRVFYYVDQLIASDIMEKSKLKMIKTAYIYLLAARAYHPEFAPVTKSTINRIEELFNQSQNYRSVIESKFGWESNSQIQTELMLKRNNIPFEKEKLIAITRVDFFIPPGIVLEILGESHFFNKEIDMYSKIKRKIFISIGYRTLYVTDAFLKSFENKSKLMHSINKIRLEQLEAKGMKVDNELRETVAKGEAAKAETEKEAAASAKRNASSQLETAAKTKPQDSKEEVKLGKSRLFSNFKK